MKDAIQKITLNEQDLYEEALGYFIRYSGLDLTKGKHRRMMDAAYQAREAGLSGIDVRAVVSRWDGSCISGGALARDGETLACNAFSQIPDGAVLFIYTFVVTAGECVSTEGDPITMQLFAHTWGTAYVDVARIALAKAFCADARRSLSKSDIQLSSYFGPGFYGMPMTENQRLCAWLHAESIGVTTKDNGLMLPLKSCSGLYLAMSDLSAMPPESCEACVGNPKGCAYCRNGMRKANVAEVIK